MTEEPSGDVTQLLVDWSNGDGEALDKLMPVVYDELHDLAARYLRRERQGHTLQTTALVNEAYLRLIDQTRIDWKNSLQFYALAARMMRRILVDHARAHRYKKRGGGAAKIPLDDAPQVSIERAPDYVAVDDALKSSPRSIPSSPASSSCASSAASRTARSANTWGCRCPPWCVVGESRRPGSTAT